MSRREDVRNGADAMIPPVRQAIPGSYQDSRTGVGAGTSYAELYIEHAPAARRVALSLVPRDVADDIVGEAFARVLAAIREGGGPSHAFRAYLLRAVRNLAHDWLAASRRVTVIGDMDDEVDDLAGRSRVMSEPGPAAETEAETRAEARLIVRAFSRLPVRWRRVLWQLEVEGKAPADVAVMFGLSANGVSALAMRAREGLRQAYLQEHIGANIPQACRACAEELGAGTRGRLSPRRQAAMQAHLRHCPSCQSLYTELSELNGKLGTILAPIALASASAALHSGRHALLRAGLSAQWRSWRWHPVTAAAGAVAGVAVAGGMLFAVNVTPVTGSPSHAAAHAAAPPAAASGPLAGRNGQGKRGGGGGGGGGTSAGPSGTLTGVAGTAGTIVTGLASTAGTAGTAVTGLASTASATVTGVASTAAATVTGVANTVSTTANDAANTAAAAVTGAASTVTATASSLASTVSTTAATTASTAAAAVTGVASSASTTVTAVAGTATAASTGTTVSATVSATVTGATGTVGGIL